VHQIVYDVFLNQSIEAGLDSRHRISADSSKASPVNFRSKAACAAIVSFFTASSRYMLEPRRTVCYPRHVNDRISISPKVCHGQACIRGTRIPVHQIVRMFAHGDSVEALLRAYPSITREDIMACLDYAASLAEEQITPLDDAVLAP
jgi:uncharacterized protein (DUF433 family)